MGNRRYSIICREYTDYEIEQQRLFNVFVFSLPRCGSSMMTGIVERLGVNMVYTSEDDKEQRETRQKKKLGEYVPNEFFGEITKNQWENQLKILSTPYSGCKMIIPVQGFHFDLVRTVPSKVVMMWRDPEEIRQSQNAFYNNATDVAYFESALVMQEQELKDGNIDHIIVKYQDVIDNPIDTISKVATFISAPNPIDEAVKFVEPSKKRFNKDELVEGI